MIGCTTDVSRKKLDVPSIFRLIRKPVPTIRAEPATAPAKPAPALLVGFVEPTPLVMRVQCSCPAALELEPAEQHEAGEEVAASECELDERPAS